MTKITHQNLNLNHTTPTYQISQNLARFTIQFNHGQHIEINCETRVYQATARPWTNPSETQKLTYTSDSRAKKQSRRPKLVIRIQTSTTKLRMYTQNYRTSQNTAAIARFTQPNSTTGNSSRSIAKHAPTKLRSGHGTKKLHDDESYSSGSKPQPRNSECAHKTTKSPKILHGSHNPTQPRETYQDQFRNRPTPGYGASNCPSTKTLRAQTGVFRGSRRRYGRMQVNGEKL